jgi:hypothetical protein
MVLSYSALYASTPFGLAIIAVCAGVGIALRAAGRGNSLEAIGLVAGPGLFAFLVAWSADEGVAIWLAVGGLFVAAAILVYALEGRARCARSV